MSTTTTTPAKHRWFFRKNKRGKWVWRRKARNGRIVEGSTQGYVRLIDCKTNARLAGWDETCDTRFTR